MSKRETVKVAGETWNIYSIWEENGTAMVNLTRTCTGHWHGGMWVAQKHTVTRDVELDSLNLTW